MSSTSVDRLRRFARGATDHSTCDVCRSELTDQHHHLLEVAHRRLLCACDACALLFSDAKGSRFRPIPTSVTRIEMELSDAQWSGLGIPIGLAFFTLQDTSPAQRGRSDAVAAGWGSSENPMASSVQPEDPLPGLRARPLPQAGEVTAPVLVGYPSPAGPVMSSVEQDDWQSLINANPDVGRLRPEVQSLLINRTAEHQQSYIVPLDVCFELIGIVRRHWDGWSGGPEVHREIDCFFDQLDVSAAKGVAS